LPWRGTARGDKIPAGKLRFPFDSASAEFFPVATGSAVIGLYDHLGLLRFASCDREACLAYAALFEMGEDSYTLEELAGRDDGSLPLAA